jgi:hypothetical protein
MMNKKKIGVVGVDSGQLLVCDPCYLNQYKDTEYDAPIKKGDFSYASVCKVTLTPPDHAGQINHKLGHAGRAVAFSSGFGDGVYPVYAYYKNYGTKRQPDMQIRKVEILMITD